MATLKDIFDQAREDAGGKEEGELSGRYPDTRMWAFYNLRWRTVRGQNIKLDGLSFAGAQTGIAGEYTITPAAADTKALAILLAATASADAVWLLPSSLAIIHGEGENPLKTGSPTRFYLDTVDGAPKIRLWPVPSASWSVTLFGEGGVAAELDDDDFDDDGMLLTSGSPKPSEVAAAQPEAFTLATMAYLAYCIAKTDERTKGTNIETNAWNSYQYEMTEAKSAWFTAVPGRTIQHTSPRRRLR